MYKSVTLFAALAASGLVAEAAWAKTFPIKFVSQTALAAACNAKPGGVSYTQGGGVYGCVGAGIVECNSNTKTCTGTTPGRTAPGSVIGTMTGTGVAVSVGAKPPRANGVLGPGILESGPVLSSQGPAATGSPVGGGRPTAPSAPPVIIR